MKQHKQGWSLWKVLVFAGGLILTLSGSSCVIDKDLFADVTNVATNATSVVEDAIEKIDMNSANWQSALDDAIAKLTAAGNSTATRLEQISQRAIEASGAEVRCSIDFIGDRVKEQLQVLLAELKHETPPALKPVVCSSIPDNVTASEVPNPVTHLTFGGYNLNLGNLRAQIETVSGSKREVTPLLNAPTNYSVTLPFGPSGATLGSTDRRIKLLWKDQDLQSVGITQPPPPECRVQTVEFIPSPITFTPQRHTHGDKDFDGNGPKVWGTVTLLTTHEQTPNAVNRVKIRIDMTAKETKSDWTTVTGQGDFDVYNFPPGYMILQRVEPAALQSNFLYTDNNHSDDTLYPGQGPAREIVVVGDTEGNDVGRTRATVHFNTIRFQIKQVPPCQ